ncbi:MAG: hypothetical protein ACMXYC_00030 [Candidatus Woesearchaeota archaeon]
MRTVKQDTFDAIYALYVAHMPKVPDNKKLPGIVNILFFETSLDVLLPDSPIIINAKTEENYPKTYHTQGDNKSELLYSIQKTTLDTLCEAIHGRITPALTQKAVDGLLSIFPTRQAYMSNAQQRKKCVEDLLYAHVPHCLKGIDAGHVMDTHAKRMTTLVYQKN